MLIWHQPRLRDVVAEYIRHYNAQRPHRSRHLRPPQPTHPIAALTHEGITRRPVLGGLINEYERAGEPLLTMGGRLVEPHSRPALRSGSWRPFGPHPRSHVLVHDRGHHRQYVGRHQCPSSNVHRRRVRARTRGAAGVHRANLPARTVRAMVGQRIGQRCRVFRRGPFTDRRYTVVAWVSLVMSRSRSDNCDRCPGRISRTSTAGSDGSP